MRRPVILSLALALCLMLPQFLLAQATGKLAGRVTDEVNGAPIPGATVVLQGTTLGSATDADGNYFIIGVRPGTYDVRVSFVGYGTKVIDGVLVTSDRTTSLDATIAEEVVGAAEIVVEAARPVVDPNQTTSRALVTGEEINRLPVASLSEVIAKTSNSWNGYIRGSRRFETKTVLEGIDISDAYYAVSPGPNGGYGGNVYHNTNKTDQTSPSMFDLNPDGISEVAVNSGATEAKYTSGSGGVVTVNLTEQRGPIRGGITARIAPSIKRPGPDTLDFYHERARRAEAGDGSIDMDGDGYISLGETYFEAKAALQELANAGDAVAAARLAYYTWDFDKYKAGDNPDIDLRGNVGGSITDDLHFFFTGRYNESHGYMPHQFDAALSGQLKATYELSDKSSLTAIGVFEDRGFFLGQWKNRDYNDFWRFYLEGVAQNEAGTYLGSLRFRQVLDENSFLTAQVYRTYSRDIYGYPDDDGNGFTDIDEDGDFIDFADPDVIRNYIGVQGTDTHHDKMFESSISDPFSDSGVFLLNGLRYRTSHPVPYGEDTKVATNGIKLDYANQLNLNHFLQAGAEAKLRDIAYEEYYGVDGLGFTVGSPQAEGSCDAEGGSCRNREPYIPQKWDRAPWEVALYASDRMEYAGLIINLGLRVEMHNRDMEEFNDTFFPLDQQGVVASEFWDRDVAGSDTLTRLFFDRGDDVGMDVFFNPSLGVSHPIGTWGAMYFSYKRAQQLQTYDRLYQRYGGNHSASRFFQYADPNIDPITSDNYELGMQAEVWKGWGFDVNAYVRYVDNFGISGFNANNRTPPGESQPAGHPLYTYYTDYGYADARGIEVVLRRAPLAVAEDIRLGLTASYTFSTVEAAGGAGVSQTTFNAVGPDGIRGTEDDIQDTQLPFENAEHQRSVPLNIRGGSSVIETGFDRRHRGVIRGTATFPYEIALGLNATVESGFLYSPAIVENERDRALETGPANYTIDFRAEKRFTFDRYGFDLFVDVTNLTNRHNVIAYDSNVQGPGPFLFQEEGIPASTLVLIDGSPIYGPARQIYFGARVRF